MGNNSSINKVNFEDIQNILSSNSNNNIILINTLKNNSESQTCILPKTVKYYEEESVINNYINKDKNVRIIIYGMNSSDITVYKKYTQLIELGFNNVYVYSGGMFEWLLLQDIYGDDLFQTTTKELDILKYKPNKQFKDERNMFDLV
jgi:rhodanese-related sulfurtransferase